MVRGRSLRLTSFLFFFYMSNVFFAQPSDVISRVEIDNAVANQPLEIKAEL